MLYLFSGKYGNYFKKIFNSFGSTDTVSGSIKKKEIFVIFENKINVRLKIYLFNFCTNSFLFFNVLFPLFLFLCRLINLQFGYYGHYLYVRIYIYYENVYILCNFSFCLSQCIKLGISSNQH